jgi:cellulose synthase/poly-beta-1,6-N-acetylglucosamine synthase-like glycosyltransferase
MVTVLIPAHNEAKIIRRKIENTLALDYPEGRMEVLLISDGSDDGTDEIAASFSGPGVTAIAYPERRGKLKALLAALPRARGDILVFSDASGMLRPAALREMVSNFADPRVGCVCGYYRSPALAKRGEGGELAYWDYEFAIKRAESRFSTLLGATGAMYAVRRGAFVTPDSDIINDDFVIPALVTLNGYRTVLEECAIVDDCDPRMGDFKRRVRVAGGNWQQTFSFPGLLSPRNPVVCWQFVSHKFLRMVSPLLIIGVLASVAVILPWLAVLLMIFMVLMVVPWGKGASGGIGAAGKKFIEANLAGLCGMALFFIRPSALKWN